MAKSKGNLNVRVGEELLNRINKVAGAMGKSQTEFVKEVLDERTKEHESDVKEIGKYEKRIVERENASKRGR
jgi:hypothetical protein